MKWGTPAYNSKKYTWHRAMTRGHGLGRSRARVFSGLCRSRVTRDSDLKHPWQGALTQGHGSCLVPVGAASGKVRDQYLWHRAMTRNRTKELTLPSLEVGIVYASASAPIKLIRCFKRSWIVTFISTSLCAAYAFANLCVCHRVAGYF